MMRRAGPRPIALPAAILISSTPHFWERRRKQRSLAALNLKSSKTDNVTAKDIADILSLTSNQHAAAKDESSKTGQDVRAGVPPKAIVGAEAKPIIEASAGPETRVAAQAAQIAPASNGQLDQKDAVRSRTPATDAAFTSSADVPKSTMPQLVVTPPARNDLPKAKVVRQEAHLPPVAASTMHARGGVAAVAGGSSARDRRRRTTNPPLSSTPG